MTVGRVRALSQRVGSEQPDPDEFVIVADRTNSSLGNPFEIGKMYTRRQAIDLNNKRLQEDEAKNGPMTRIFRHLGARVAEGKKVAFLCWCAPEECHVDAYVAAVRRYAGLEEPKTLFDNFGE